MNQEDIKTVRDALEEFYERRNGCPDKTCGVCRRLQNQFIEAVSALDRLADQPAPTETVPHITLKALRARAKEYGMVLVAETAPQGAPHAAGCKCRTCWGFDDKPEGAPRPPIEFCCKRCGLTVDEVAGGACASLAGPEHDWSNPRSGVVK